MLNSFLQFFYPARCRSCNSLVPSEEFLCAACLAYVKPVVSLYIPLTKKHILKVYAAGAYQDPLRPLVLKKISSDLSASKQLGAFMLKMIPFDVIPCDFFVPIPLHWTRYARRGYNQATEMAKVMGNTINAPVVPLLSRYKRTVFQATLTGVERQENVDNAFAVNVRYRLGDSCKFKGKHIVLVDDLYTTGSTMKSAARALLHYEPRSITAVVACRAI